MRCFLMQFIALFCLGSTILVARAEVLLNFDTASELDSLANTSASSSPLVWGKDAGVGGSGGVITSGETEIGDWLFSPRHFDATQTDKGFTLSYYFKTSATLPTGNGQAIGGIGLAKDASMDLLNGPAADRILLQVMKWNEPNNIGGWAFAVNNSTSSSHVIGDFSISPETWYKLEAVFTQALNGQWTIQMDLWSYGSNGTETPSSVASVLRNPSVHSAYTGVGSSREACMGILSTGRLEAFDLVETDVELVP